jgi:phenylacetate-CoA ligase
MDFIFNSKTETMPRKKIQELQLKRLKKTVHLIYENVPHYKKRFKEQGIKPQT